MRWKFRLIRESCVETPSSTRKASGASGIEFERPFVVVSRHLPSVCSRVAIASIRVPWGTSVSTLASLPLSEKPFQSGVAECSGAIG